VLFLSPGAQSSSMVQIGATLLFIWRSIWMDSCCGATSLGSGFVLPALFSPHRPHIRQMLMMMPRVLYLRHLSLKWRATSLISVSMRLGCVKKIC
jgi:hypothetical protein